MPRTYLVFGDIEGKLDILCVECTKCDRKGRYHVAQGQQVEVDHDSRDSIRQRPFDPSRATATPPAR